MRWAQKALNEKLKTYVIEFGGDGLSDNLLLISVKNRFGQVKSLLDDSVDEKKRAKALIEIEKLEAKILEIESGKIYENAFEWRFEFPEVLDDNGDFIGFDVVIGNPPYIQLNKLKEIDYSKFNYNVFDKTGDILALFCEKGLEILNQKGVMNFIVSNSWLKTKYGEPLKKLLETNGEAKIINFEDSQIFDEATVESCIIEFTKENVLPIGLTNVKNFSVKNASPQSLAIALTEGSSDSSAEQNLMQKIERIGKHLKDWNVSIYRGVLTGFNEAFIIDSAKRDELIAKDAKSTELLKPILRGRDVQRYATNWAGLWLINSHNNPPVDINNYPAIKE